MASDLLEKSGNVRCGVPNQFAGNKSLTAKGDRGMNTRELPFVFTESGELCPAALDLMST